MEIRPDEITKTLRDRIEGMDTGASDLAEVGTIVSVADGWRHGPSRDKGGRWNPAEIGSVVRELIAEAAEPVPVYGA